MPYKNKVKNYVSDATYHVYARGLNKQDIFKDEHDYNTFKYLLKKYLSKEFYEEKEVSGNKIKVYPNSVHGLLELKAYCLMPNHFHILATNIQSTGITKLMSRLLTQYTSFFNTKYNRQGPLIHGSNRAVKIKSDQHLITIGKYIHLNPFDAKLVTKLEKYPYSTYKNYLYKKETKYLTLDKLLLESVDWQNLEKFSGKIEENEDEGIIY